MHINRFSLFLVLLSVLLSNILPVNANGAKIVNKEVKIKQELIAQFGDDLEIFAINLLDKEAHRVEIVETPFVEHDKVCRFRTVLAQRVTTNRWEMDANSLVHKIARKQPEKACNYQKSVVEASPVTSAQFLKTCDFFQSADKIARALAAHPYEHERDIIGMIVRDGQLDSIGLVRDEPHNAGVLLEVHMALANKPQESVVVYLQESLDTGLVLVRIELVNA